jgi:hypothetical protein
MTEAERITRELGGKWYRRYGLACCPAHGDRRPSLTLNDASDGKLLAHCKTGCAFIDVLDALRARGIVEGAAQRPATDPAIMARKEAEARADAVKRERQALTLWREGLPIHGTLAETYLRVRGITCPLPVTLRYAPASWHPTAKRLRAMLARVDGAERFAMHRTYLAPDGRGKAAIDPPKAMLGAVAGGAVRLTDAQAPLVVAEGIETGLSLASGLLGRPATIWAALSTSGLMGLVLPPVPSRLTIATDGDDAGRKAGVALADRATALGWAVSLLPAPQGRDWNDIFCMKGAIQ